MGAPWENPVTLARAYKKYGSAEKIADAWSCSDRTIRTWLHKHDGIDVQSRGRPQSWTTEDPPNHVLEDDEGYEIVESFVPVWDDDGELERVERKVCRVHRLVCVAEWGFDQVADKEVHHRNGGKIDNRGSNLVPLDPKRHGYVGTKYRDRFD